MTTIAQSSDENKEFSCTSSQGDEEVSQEVDCNFSRPQRIKRAAQRLSYSPFK